MSFLKVLTLAKCFGCAAARDIQYPDVRSRYILWRTLILRGRLEVGFATTEYPRTEEFLSSERGCSRTGPLHAVAEERARLGELDTSAEGALPHHKAARLASLESMRSSSVSASSLVDRAPVRALKI
jgi:hypothetical protein